MENKLREITEGWNSAMDNNQNLSKGATKSPTKHKKINRKKSNTEGLSDCISNTKMSHSKKSKILRSSMEKRFKDFFNKSQKSDTRVSNLNARINPVSLKIDQVLLAMGKVSPRISVCLEVVYLLIMNTLIFSEGLSRVFDEDFRGKNGLNIVQISSSQSDFGRIFRGFEFTRMTKGLTAASSLVFLMVLVVALGILISYFFFHKSLFEGKKLMKSPKSLLHKQSMFVRLIAVVLVNYQLVFFVSNKMAMSSFFCHEVEYFTTVNQAPEILSSIGNVHVDTALADIPLFVYENQAGSNQKIVMGTKYSSYLSNDIECGSASHITSIILSLVLGAINGFLLIFSNKILALLPDNRIRQSRNGLFDLATSLILCLMQWIMLYLESSGIRSQGFGIYLWVLAALSCVSHFSMLRYKPYYGWRYRRMKGFIFLYIFVVSGVQSISFIDVGVITIDEKFAVFYILVILSFLTKLDYNLMRRNLNQLIQQKFNFEKMSSIQILTTYYKIKNYIAVAITEKTTIDGWKEEMKIFVIRLKNVHQRTCRQHHCFCRRHPVFMRTNSLTVSLKVISKEEFVLEALMLMEEIFKKYIQNRKRDKDRDMDDKVFNCYIDFLVNYLGKPSLAYKLIYDMKFMKLMKEEKKKKGKQADYENLELGVLLAQLNRLAFDNLKLGSLSLRNHQSEFKDDLTLSLEDEGRIGLLDHVVFLDNFETMKKEIRQAIDLKARFLEEMLSLTPKLSNLADLSFKFYNKKQIVDYIFQTLIGISGNKYAPLYCVYGHFLLDVCDTRKKAIAVLKRYERIAGNFNLNTVFAEIGRRHEECIIMKVKAERQVQKFTYVTSNVKHWLGFTVEQVIGSPLDVIIPDPLDKIHKTYFNFDRTQRGGRMFIEKYKRNFICLNAPRYLIKGDFTLRFGINLSNTLEFAASCNVNLKSEEVCLVLTDHLGKITAITETANSLFKAGDNIGKYNRIFSSVYNSINDICLDMLEEVDFNSEEYLNLIMQRGWLQKWALYCKWQKFQRVNILDKRGKVKNISIRIQNFLMHERYSYVRFLVIKEHSNTTYSDFDPMGAQKDTNETRIMKKVVEIIERFSNPNIKEGTEFDIISKQVNRKVAKDHEKELMDDIFLEKQDDTPNSFDGRSKKEDSSKVKVQEGGRKSSLMGIDSLDSEEKSGTVTQSKLMNAPLDNIFEGDSYDSVRAEESVEKMEKKKKGKVGQLVGSRMLSDNSSALRIKDRFILIESLIHNHLNPDKIHRNTIITIALFLSLISIGYWISTMTSPLYESVSREIDNNLDILDAGSWLVWSSVSSAIGLETCRGTRERWFDNNISKPYRQGETLYEICDYLVTEAGAFQLAPENAVDRIVREFQFLQLFDYQKWINTEIRLEILNRFEQDNGANFEFKQVSLPRRSAVKYIQGRASKFHLRDYQNSSEITNFDNPKNRLVDLAEEEYRRLLLGDFNKKYAYRIDDINDYFKNLNSYFRDMELLYFTSSAVILLGFTFIYLTYMVFQVKRIKVFYTRLLDLKINHIKAYKVNFEAIKTKMNSILTEEKFYEQNKVDVDLEEEVNKANNARSDKKRKSGISGKSQRRLNRVEKLRINVNAYNMSILKSLIALTAIISTLLFTKFLFTGYMINLTEISKNSLEIYSLGVLSWNSFYSLHAYLLQTILWNNTLPTWEGQTSLDTYQYYRNYIENRIMDNYTRSLDFNIGDYTEEFKYKIEEANTCDTIFELVPEKIEPCYLFNDGLFKGNIINSLRGILTSSDMLLEEWNAKRGDWEDVRTMFTHPRFVFILSSFQPFMNYFYIWSISISTKVLQDYNSRQLRVINLTNVLMALFCLVLSILVIVIGVNSIQKRMSGLYKMLFVMPIYFVKRNKLLTAGLLKMIRGETRDLF